MISEAAIYRDGQKVHTISLKDGHQHPSSGIHECTDWCTDGCPTKFWVDIQAESRIHRESKRKVNGNDLPAKGLLNAGDILQLRGYKESPERQSSNVQLGREAGHGWAVPTRL